MCSAADVESWLAALSGARAAEQTTVEEGTHLLHLEPQRGELHDVVRRFLELPDRA